jgi:DNA-binding transcriptional LysR family regulator
MARDPDIPWDDWRLFLAAWNAGSLSAAAEELGLAQATLSRRISGLEVALGQLLFDRTVRGLAPTAAARALVPHAEAMAAAASSARAACDGLEREPEGLVRLAVPEGFAVDLLPRLLPRLAQRHPRIRLEVLADPQLADLASREADLAIRAARPEGGDLVVRRLFDEAVGLFAAPALIVRLPRGAGLADVPYATLTEGVGGSYTAATTALFGRPPAFAASRWVVVRAAVAAGFGALLTSEGEAASLGLVPVPVAMPPFPRSAWYLVVPRPLRTVPRVAAVVGLVEELVAPP